MTEQERIPESEAEPPQEARVCEVALQLSEVRQSLSDIVTQVAEGERRIIVEKYERPRVVILSFADYERYKRLEETLGSADAERFMMLENQYAEDLRRLEEERYAIRQALRQYLPAELEQVKRTVEKMQRDLRNLPTPDQ